MITKLKRGTFQHVEGELYDYHETKREINQLVSEIIHGVPGGDENVGGGKSNIPGNPTLRRATVLATHKLLDSMQTNVEAIEYVYNRARPEYKRLIEIRYWRSPQTLTWEGVAQELKVSRKQALQWRDTVVKAVADKLGWI